MWKCNVSTSTSAFNKPLESKSLSYFSFDHLISWRDLTISFISRYSPKGQNLLNFPSKSNYDVKLLRSLSLISLTLSNQWYFSEESFIIYWNRSAQMLELKLKRRSQKIFRFIITWLGARSREITIKCSSENFINQMDARKMVAKWLSILNVILINKMKKKIFSEWSDNKFSNKCLLNIANYFISDSVLVSRVYVSKPRVYVSNLALSNRAA